MNSKISISSIGDVSFAGGFLKRPELLHSWISDEIKEFLKADICIANMEYVILPDGEKWPGGLCLTETVESLEALKYAGINAVALGNNHILDFKREEGMLATIKALQATEIKHCGAGLNLEEARKPAIINAKGKKVAIFSRLHDYSFINIKPVAAGENTPGVALLDLNEITETISQYRKNTQCDIAILCLHWGMQNLHHHSKRVHELGKKLLSNGVDLVLGSHSHVLQGLAEYNNKFCFYGQGNFYFYPYPLEGQPNGLLYGPEAVRRRIAMASKFTYDQAKWSCDFIATVQDANEVAHRLPEPIEAKLQYKARKIWNEYHPFAFHVQWRLERLKQHGKRFLYEIKNKNLKGICYFLNPLRCLKIAYEIIRPQSLG